jgi:hypothetical protein
VFADAAAEDEDEEEEEEEDDDLDSFLEDAAEAALAHVTPEPIRPSRYLSRTRAGQSFGSMLGVGSPASSRRISLTARPLRMAARQPSKTAGVIVASSTVRSCGVMKFD